MTHNIGMIENNRWVVEYFSKRKGKLFGNTFRTNFRTSLYVNEFLIDGRKV